MELDEQTIRMIYKELNISSNKIQNIMPLKKGMTNRSFSFLAEKEHKN